jgi:hypothetical protein
MGGIEICAAISDAVDAATSAIPQGFKFLKLKSI